MCLWRGETTKKPRQEAPLYPCLPPGHLELRTHTFRLFEASRQWVGGRGRGLGSKLINGTTRNGRERLPSSALQPASSLFTCLIDMRRGRVREGGAGDTTGRPPPLPPPQACVTPYILFICLSKVDFPLSAVPSTSSFVAGSSSCCRRAKGGNMLVRLAQRPGRSGLSSEGKVRAGALHCGGEEGRSERAIHVGNRFGARGRPN